jgi:hypothetical protein
MPDSESGLTTTSTAGIFVIRFTPPVGLKTTITWLASLCKAASHAQSNRGLPRNTADNLAPPNLEEAPAARTMTANGDELKTLET